MRDALSRFVADVTAADAGGVRETVAWPRVERLLRGLGFEPSLGQSGGTEPGGG
jgi:hypothetical protein